MSDSTNKQLIQALAKFGLDDIEAIIYLHLHANGPQTPLSLSREISINRTRIYRYLEKLQNKKLIEISGEPRGKKLVAASPANLGLLVQEEETRVAAQKEALPQLFKDLEALPVAVQKEFMVRHYKGAEGIKQILWNQLAANGEILAFSYKNKNDMVGKSFAEKLRENQVEKKITLYEIENETDQGDYWYTNVANWGKYYQSRFIDPKTLAIKQYIAVFNNTVSIANWINEEFVGIEIENAIFANTERQFFWKFWEIAGLGKEKADEKGDDRVEDGHDGGTTKDGEDEKNQN